MKTFNTVSQWCEHSGKMVCSKEFSYDTSIAESIVMTVTYSLALFTVKALWQEI